MARPRLPARLSLALQASSRPDDGSTMGVDNRDCFRDPGTRRRPQPSITMVALVLAGLIAGLLAAAAIRAQTESPAAAYGTTRQSRSGPMTVSLLPGLPGITFGGDPLYDKNDPWLGYLAAESTCPGGEQLNAPLAD